MTTGVDGMRTGYPWATRDGGDALAATGSTWAAYVVSMGFGIVSGASWYNPLGNRGNDLRCVSRMLSSWRHGGQPLTRHDGFLVRKRGDPNTSSPLYSESRRGNPIRDTPFLLREYALFMVDPIRDDGFAQSLPTAADLRRDRTIRGGGGELTIARMYDLLMIAYGDDAARPLLRFGFDAVYRVASLAALTCGAVATWEGGSRYDSGCDDDLFANGIAQSHRMPLMDSAEFMDSMLAVSTLGEDEFDRRISLVRRALMLGRCVPVDIIRPERLTGSMSIDYPEDFTLEHMRTFGMAPSIHSTSSLCDAVCNRLRNRLSAHSAIGVAGTDCTTDIDLILSRIRDILTVTTRWNITADMSPAILDMADETARLVDSMPMYPWELWTLASSRRNRPLSPASHSFDCLREGVSGDGLVGLLASSGDRAHGIRENSILCFMDGTSSLASLHAAHAVLSTGDPEVLYRWCVFSVFLQTWFVNDANERRPTPVSESNRWPGEDHLDIPPEAARYVFDGVMPESLTFDTVALTAGRMVHEGMSIIPGTHAEATGSAVYGPNHDMTWMDSVIGEIAFAPADYGVMEWSRAHGIVPEPDWMDR